MVVNLDLFPIVTLVRRFYLVRWMKSRRMTMCPSLVLLEETQSPVKAIWKIPGVKVDLLI